MGSIYDKIIVWLLVLVNSSATPTASGTTSITIPGKFYVGVNTQKLTEESRLYVYRYF
jgi:hypothetical protein